MRTEYIGSFPPPYGGVTIKNQLLYDEISKHIEVCRVNGSRKFFRKFKQATGLLHVAFMHRKFIIGISAKGGKSKAISKIMYTFNRRSMNNSLYFMMGGLEAGNIAVDPQKLKMYKEYRQVYVETNSMKEVLNKVGLNNVSVFPNCRRKPEIEYEPLLNNKLKCVFFSQVTREKGVDLVIDAARQLPNISFDIYGDGDLQLFADSENISYKGLYEVHGNNVYSLLNQYDILLFPTRWKSEGVPGVLVESKISGITAIVSNVAYNSEIIHHGIDGLVMEDLTSNALVTCIRKLDEDRNLLMKLKKSAEKSSKAYYIDVYIDNIISNLC